MSAKIVRLTGVRRSDVITPAGIVFPQIYRVTGFNFKLSAEMELKNGLIHGEGVLEETTDPVPPSYTVDTERTAYRIAKQKCTPIKHLDPSLDKGWLVIRHHKSAEELHGYISALIDTNDHLSDATRCQGFSTDLGYFSVLHRSPKLGTPDCLIIYMSEVETILGPGDHPQIMDSQGNWRDEDVIYSEEHLEQTSGIMDIINKG